MTTVELGEDYVLEHFGIRGMRWGVRRQRGLDGRVSDDAARAETLRNVASTSGPRALTNKELQDLNQRLNLEQNYSRLTTPKNTTTMERIKKGQEFVKGIIGVATTAQQVHNTINSPMMKSVASSLEAGRKKKPTRASAVTRATVSAMRPAGFRPRRPRAKFK